MSEPKTQLTTVEPKDFIKTIEHETRRQDGFELLEMYERITGLPAKMWGPSIVGFGTYQVTSGSQTNEWPLAGFSPRKQNLTLYVSPEDFPELLQDLGKYKTSKACLYLNKLADVDRPALEKLIAASYERDRKKYVS